MEDIERHVMCNRCKRSVPISEMRYLIEEKGPITSVCLSCKDKVSSGVVIPKKQSTKKPYICSRCKYQFRANKDPKGVIRCPYCGRPDKVAENKAASAESIIKSSNAFDF